MLPRKSRPRRPERAHVDSIGRSRKQPGSSREVWDNPILWREICTWAYGRKVAAIRVAYLFFFAMAAVGLYLTLTSTTLAESNTGLSTVLPAMATPLLPFFLVSLVIMNALAVNAITNERDGLTLDLLLVTDLTPREFIFGKLGGILWLTKEMVLLPLGLLPGYLDIRVHTRPGNFHGKPATTDWRPAGHGYFCHDAGHPLWNHVCEFSLGDHGQHGCCFLSVPGRGHLHHGHDFLQWIFPATVGSLPGPHSRWQHRTLCLAWIPQPLPGDVLGQPAITVCHVPCHHQFFHST